MARLSMVCCARFGLEDVAYLAKRKAGSQSQPLANERTAAALMKVEHEWLDALHRRDVKTLQRILAPEFIDNYYLGQEITRREYLAYFAQPPVHPTPTVPQHFEDTRVRFLANGDVAIVTGVVVTEPAAGSADSSASGTSSVHHSRFTDVFVWRDSCWQAVTAQETHFSPQTK